MKPLIKNTRGMTLIEILAVTLITSIVAILVFSIIQASIRQQVQQTTKIDNLNDITYALKIVTKDIRRSTSAKVSDDNLELTFIDASKATYSVEDEQLKKTNGANIEIIIDGIGCAKFSGEEVILIKLSNTNECSEGQSTEIHVRKGGN